MNKLILIGNGFDLAHGLKTSYTDFILWYLNKSLQPLKNNRNFEDDLMKLKWRNYLPSMEFKSIPDFLSAKQHYLDVEYKNSFLETIITQSASSNWVDLESKYYEALVALYKRLEKLDQISNSRIDADLRVLNQCFNSIKIELAEYLSTIDNKLDKINENINLHLFEESVNARLGLGKKGRGDKNKILILNFNYTSTIEKYLEKDPENPFTINYIHGKLNDDNNPIIFGYGDEMHKHYEKIEQLDNDEFLRNIKSFGYFRTKNYQDFESFIDSAPFHAYIMGHSCGLSDRILLNSIFEHSNCEKIKIFYHQKNNIENDYLEKTQKISRHFKADAKSEMRKKIVPFSDSLPLTKY